MINLWGKHRKFVSRDARASLQEYIKERFDDIVPYEVHGHVRFQIRIGKKEYAKLSKKYKTMLMKYSEKPRIQNLVERDIEKRYVKDYYWSPCECYLFHFEARRFYLLKKNCVYGYEGCEESNDLYFIDNREFPSFIIENIGLQENQKVRK